MKQLRRCLKLEEKTTKKKTRETTRSTSGTVRGGPSNPDSLISSHRLDVRLATKRKVRNNVDLLENIHHLVTTRVALVLRRRQLVLFPVQVVHVRMYLSAVKRTCRRLLVRILLSFERYSWRKLRRISGQALKN